MPWELIDEEPTLGESAVNLGKNIPRHAARTTEKLATRAIGLPGDILSLLNEYVAKPSYEALSGKEGSPYEETFLGKAIPTTETHRKNIESQFGEYLKPQNKYEEFADDVLEDAFLLFTPGGKAAKGIKKISPMKKSVKAFSKSLGANLAGETVSEATGREDIGNLVKAGGLFTASLIDQPAIHKQISRLYESARSNLPEGASISASLMNKRLDNLEKVITGGRPKGSVSADKKFVLDQIDKVRALEADGKYPIQSLWDQKIDLNKDLAGLYQIPGKKNQKTARNFAKKITSSINDTIKDYGKENPSFYKPFREADEAFGTMAQSDILSKWAEKSLKFTPLSTGLLHVFGIPFAGIGTAVAGGATVAYPAGKILYRISKSPTLRDLYGKSIKAAAKEDSIAFNKYAKELDEHLSEEEASERWEFID